MTASFVYSVDHYPPAPMIEVTVRWRHAANVKALIDTGADVSMFSVDVLRKIGAQYLETCQLRGIVGSAQMVNLYLSFKLMLIELLGLRLSLQKRALKPLSVAMS